MIQNKEIKPRIIDNKINKQETKTETYNSLKELKGIIKLDHETDSVKLKKSVYTKDQ